MIEKIAILQHGEGCYLNSHSCVETGRFLGIVAYYYKLVIKQGKVSLNSFSETLVSPLGRCPVLLVLPVRDIKLRVILAVSNLKQVQLHKCAQVSFCLRVSFSCGIPITHPQDTRVHARWLLYINIFWLTISIRQKMGILSIKKGKMQVIVLVYG